MIIAGIDEAGYGPLLGPLVVGCCAMEVPCDPGSEIPCLWTVLSRLVSRHRSRNGRKIHVNDSKEVYSPSAGLKELERSILTMWMSGGHRVVNFDEFIQHVAPDAPPDLAQHPWYGPSPQERFPFEQEMLGLALFANGLAAEMQRAAVRVVHLNARVVPERSLNQILARTHNKASANFSFAVRHIDYLLRTFGAMGLAIFCDRQGGREHYGPLLRQMFDDWPLEIIREEDGLAEYVLQPPRGVAGPHPPVQIVFREKAEQHAMPVALASMLAKYLREALMRRFNAFWGLHVPGVAPTAGYYTDGLRFLRDIAGKRQELGIGDDWLIRSR